MTSVFDRLAEAYPAFWIDALGEHNHIGGIETTRWLLARIPLGPSDRMLDAGAFVGAAARVAAAETGVRAVATDINLDFLRAGAQMEGGACVEWVAAANQRLPFGDGSFQSVWCLDSYLAPKELTRVAAPVATAAICTEVPVDGRGGHEAFVEEWEALGWELAAHRQLSAEATHAWRMAEAQLVRKRPYFRERYGERGYQLQLDMLADLVHLYERGEQGHGLFVFRRPASSGRSA